MRVETETVTGASWLRGRAFGLIWPSKVRRMIALLTDLGAGELA